MIEKDEKLRKMKMRIKTNGKAYKHVKKEKRDANHKRKILKCIIIKFKLWGEKDESKKVSITFLYSY